jgi:hypothetical protein
VPIDQLKGICRIALGQYIPKVANSSPPANY